MIAAKLENAVVVQVIVAPSIAWCEANIGGTWLETWADGGSRKNYAGIGYSYDQVRDAFIPPRPYRSWVLDEATCQWEAPVPYPNTGHWVWDEATEEWVPA
ncbi:MAG: Synechococcus phage Bellamy [Pseudomonadota bacterium]|jgi:hypothetical protein